MMQLLKWSSQLELGIDHIDIQHKQLFSMINEMIIAAESGQPNSSLLPVVGRLQEYANSHFFAEEELFSQYDYTDRNDHEADHLKFMESVKLIRKQCELLESPMSEKIKDFLLGWLWNHIMTKDLKYKSFINRKRIP
jgi:hemerythrin-like metal-binding protein